jgi:hypothetical protein
MGNQQSNIYTIDKFIGQINFKELHTMPCEDLQNKLDNLLVTLNNDKNAYTLFKQNEENSSLTSNKMNVARHHEDEEEKDDEDEEDMDAEEASKSKKFFKIITSLININLYEGFHGIYLTLLKIMHHLSKV